MLSLSEARERILAEAVPGEAIEVTLTEAQGLVLAEDLFADVDLPPFDRAGYDGYAAKAIDLEPNATLDVIVSRKGNRSAGAKTAELTLDRGETVHIAVGDPMPVGADTVVRTEDSRPEPGVGAPREIVVLKVSISGQSVIPRGYFLKSGTLIATAGTRLKLPMVALLAAEGCVHPLCYRRARVAVLSVGDHLVGSGEAPVMHRERNASGPTVVAPCLQWGATAHDLGVVTERELPAALDRALTAPVVVVLGEPEGAIARALRKANVEPVFEGVSLHPGKRISYGVVRDGCGRVAHHLFQMAPNPVGVLAGVALLLGPLIARLHGGPESPGTNLRAVWTGPRHRPTDDRLWAVPVTLAIDDNARLRASAIPYRGKDDLFGFSKAEALALLPPRSGPWNEGDVVEITALGTNGELL